MADSMQALDGPSVTVATGGHAAFGPFLRLAACNFGIATAFYLTLSSGPTHLARLGGDAAAGSATSVSAFATAAASLAAPALIARLGRRVVFALAALALALPCGLLFGSSLALAELACAVRGGGLGLVFVATGGLAAMLVPAGRRGELLGLFGLAFCVPAIFAVPAGQWLVGRSPGGLALAATACALAPLLALKTFPARCSRDMPAPLARLPWRRLAWPLVAQLAAAATVGTMITALAAAAIRDAGQPVGPAMFAYGLALALVRAGSGRLCDRIGSRAVVVLGAMLALCGQAMLARFGPWAIVAAAAMLGTAFAMQQNGTLTLMLARSAAGQSDAVSAAWNIAYDAGLGVGAMAFGGLAPRWGHGAAVLLVAGAGALLVAASHVLSERAGARGGHDAGDPRSTSVL
ncbi:MAG: MFS transporter [Burkholderiaceae bacterium]